MRRVVLVQQGSGVASAVVVGHNRDQVCVYHDLI